MIKPVPPSSHPAAPTVTRLPTPQVTEQLPSRSMSNCRHEPHTQRGYSLRAGAEECVGTGNAEKSRKALERGRQHVYQCPRCHRLVDLRSAIRKAGSEARIRTGDTCAGCSGESHRLKYRRRQVERMEAVRDGTLLMIRQPRMEDDGYRLHLGRENVLCRVSVLIDIMLA